MPRNRVTGSAKTGIVVLRTSYDKEYDLMQIAERFEVPYQEIKTPQQARAYYAMIEGVGKSVGKKAIERYERLYHWRYYSARSPVLDESEAQYDLDAFRSSNQKNFSAVNQGSIIDTKGNVAYVIKLWFIVPKIEVEVIEDEPDDPDVTDGFVNSHNMYKDPDLQVDKTRKGLIINA